MVPRNTKNKIRGPLPFAKKNSKGGKVREKSQTQTLTTCLADSPKPQNPKKLMFVNCPNYNRLLIRVTTYHNAASLAIAARVDARASNGPNSLLNIRYTWPKHSCTPDAHFVPNSKSRNELDGDLAKY